MTTDRTPLQRVQDNLTYTEYMHLVKACEIRHTPIADIAGNITAVHQRGSIIDRKYITGEHLLMMVDMGVYKDCNGNIIEL
jgi:hypothetical protein